MVAATLVLKKEQGYGTNCRKVKHLQGFTDGDTGVKCVLVWSWGGGEGGLFLELSVFGQSHTRERCDKLLR